MSIKRTIEKAIVKVTDIINGNNLSQTSNRIDGNVKYDHDMATVLRKAGSESVVLLKNNGVLPIKNKVISVFGRCQINYFYVGYGSGGDVNPPYCVNLIDGLRSNKNITINEELATIYESWCNKKENIPFEGWWGHWPYHFDEMPLNDEIVSSACAKSEVALIVIGRAAGEDRENKLESGSYYLTDDEKNMLQLVTKYFKEVVIVLDCGNIIDLSYIDTFKDKISAILYAYQLGQESGNAVSDILTGEVNPSGKLVDTIAKEYSDYPSSNNFGGKYYNSYVEDIFVGYRYFETFHKDVLYPFGFGLSYTTFEIKVNDFNYDNENLTVTVSVTNTGKLPGKEVVQLYMVPEIKILARPLKNLIAFKKTKLLNCGESEILKLTVNKYFLSSYDDIGKTGHKNCYVLEEGLYKFMIGNSVKANLCAGEINLKQLEVIKELEPICQVVEPFERLSFKNENGEVVQCKETVPVQKINLRDRILKNIPQEIPTNNENINFADVKSGKNSLDEFIGSLSLADLKTLTRGQGSMNSNLGTEGNAGAYGGTSKSLMDRGVRPIIACDGPAGIRLKKHASLLPCGTALASSWNVEMVQDLYNNVSQELIKYNIDVLLAPGMNIHRNPLCGRNFEYFSEDPVLCGKIAESVVNGIQMNGRSACPKHFALNNQETNRNKNDSRVSERALREIYLKSFEIMIKGSNPKNIMTSYNKINGVYAHYNYDLVTTVLRKEFGYKGVVITDWWMQKATSPEFKKIKNNAYRVRAQVDVLMPGLLGRLPIDFGVENSLLENVNNKEGISLAEIQRTARNVLKLELELNK